MPLRKGPVKPWHGFVALALTIEGFNRSIFGLESKEARLNFVDLYAGAGGWSVGLTSAGLTPLFSAEIWKTANMTRDWNLGGSSPRVDIRRLEAADVPDCDFLVGSPPCTQFSYANKGGNGDYADGLEDMRAFLRIVRAKNPRSWAMENVPRLQEILAVELAPGGALAEFSDLFERVNVFDMSEWGVPQRRMRCIAGRYPLERLEAFKGRIKPASLAEVLAGCAEGRDPTWGYACDTVTDNVPGVALSWEESRINREKKRFHPIYNDMAFPDNLAKVARTVTATCTKVSRESIVVPDGQGGVRLLSVRESAAIQSFPLTYQFPAPTGHSDRIKMAGNAIPPLFTYLLGLAVQGRDLTLPSESFRPQSGFSTDAIPSVRSGRISPARSFRAAIPGLRFKSGMSFELRNHSGSLWEIAFNMGRVGDKPTTLAGDALARLASVCRRVPKIPFGNETVSLMQSRWSRSEDAREHPYRVIDEIASLAADWRSSATAEEVASILNAVFAAVGVGVSEKARRYAQEIASGIAIALAFNGIIQGELALAA
jgi:DNA (cytosine-5)-methyltransferase 1